MSYLLVVILGFTVLIFILQRRSSRRKLLKEQMLQSRWGQKKAGEFNFNHICRHAVITKNDAVRQLSERVLSDCNFYDVFPIVDRTTSKVGQQYMFTKLVRPATNHETLKQFDKHVVFFYTNEKERIRVMHELFKLDNNDASFISSLLKERLLEKPWWFSLAYLNVGLLIVLGALSIVYPQLIAVALIPLILNFLIHYWNKFNTFIFLKSLPQLSVMINVCKAISAIYKIDDTDSAVQSGIRELRPFQAKLVLLNSHSEGTIKDDLGLVFSYFLELVKAVGLLEFFLLFETVKAVEKRRHHVDLLFNFVGEIDSAISVANLRSGHHRVCLPEFNESAKEFSFKGIYNPLIKNCVTNDLHLDGKSALITGSNMSGKTTFLRTVLLNSILAQSIYTCFATAFKSSMVQHFSSIQIGDSILEGKSYYFEEVAVMKDLLDAVNPVRQNLFILDEVFKGTNTIERICAAKAILSYLNRHNNIVFVSSHDIELIDWLADEYELFHFIETLHEDNLHFDHKIKPGQLRSGNAIRILELSDYPPELIREARKMVTKMETELFKSSGTKYLEQDFS